MARRGQLPRSQLCSSSACRLQGFPWRAQLRPMAPPPSVWWLLSLLEVGIETGPALRRSRAVASADELVCFHEESRARRPKHDSKQSCIVRREPRRQPSRLFHQVVIGLCSTTGNLPLISAKPNRRNQAGDHAAPTTNDRPTAMFGTSENFTRLTSPPSAR